MIRSPVSRYRHSTWRELTAITIQEAAARTGISAHTIRFYEKSGLLPAIRRSESGVRQFTEADVDFIQFVASLRRTGMSLPDIADYAQDGCSVERLQSHDFPVESINRRLAILEGHRARLIAQRQELATLLDAVNQKLDFYRGYVGPKAGEGPV